MKSPPPGAKRPGLRIIGVVNPFVIQGSLTGQHENLVSFRGKLRVRPRRYRRPFNGYEVCRQLKEHELTRHIPVLFATGATSPEEQQRALQVGGVDFLSKPYHEETVQARVLRYSKLPSL